MPESEHGEYFTTIVIGESKTVHVGELRKDRPGRHLTPMCARARWPKKNIRQTKHPVTCKRCMQYPYYVDIAEMPDAPDLS